jgi:hypothetical protein
MFHVATIVATTEPQTARKSVVDATEGLFKRSSVAVATSQEDHREWCLFDARL